MHPISLVWEHFEKKIKENYAKCLHCGMNVKNNGNTTNLKAHLERKHPKIALGKRPVQNETEEVEIETTKQNLLFSTLAVKMRAKPPTRSNPTTKPVKIKKQAKAQHKKMKEKKKDCSVLRPPVDTSIQSFSELMKIFEIGTPELKELLDHECEIIYECKICRSLFRSMPNFLMHKRSYCFPRFKDMNHNGEFKEQTLVLGSRSNALSTRTTTRKDILELLDNITNIKSDYNVNGPFVMREIEQTSQGLLNSFNHEGTHPTLERSATLGPDGRVIGSEPLKESVNCPLCDSRYETHNDLRSHASEEHPELKEYFICPVCKQYFAHCWSVYRHMCKDHRKTSEQVRKLRPCIQKKFINPDDANRQRKKANEDEIINMDERWMEELTKHASIKSCQTCGKKFDRKVAMIAHVATCGKQPLKNGRKRSIQSDVAPPPLKIMVRTDYAKKIDPLKDLNFQPRVIMTKADSVYPQNSNAQKSRLENKIQILHNVRLQSCNPTTSLIQPRLERMPIINPVIDLTSDKIDEDPIKEKKTETPNEREDINNGLVSKTHYEQTDSENENNDNVEMEEAQNENSDIIEPESTMYDENDESIDDESKDEHDDDESKDEHDDDESKIDDQENDKMDDQENDKMDDQENDDIHITSTNPKTSKRSKYWVAKKIDSYLDRKNKKCLLCLKIFSKIAYLKRHIAMHYKLNNFECTICNLKYYLRSDLFNHQMKVHNVKYPYKMENSKRLYPKMSEFNDSKLVLDVQEDEYEVKLDCLTNGHNGNISSSSMDLKPNEDHDIEMNHNENKGIKIHSDSCDSDDELVNSEKPEESDEKLKSLMMQVIFGTESNKES